MKASFSFHRELRVNAHRSFQPNGKSEAEWAVWTYSDYSPSSTLAEKFIYTTGGGHLHARKIDAAYSYEDAIQATLRCWLISRRRRVDIR